MTISDIHASHIRRVQVAFVISGKNLDHKKVSTILGLQPDVSANKGDPKILYSKMIGAHSEGIWGINTKDKVDSKDINDHLNFLLDILLPHKDTILELAQDGETYFDVLWESTYLYAGTGPLIDKKCLYGIGQLDAGMGFDIYQVREKKESSSD